MNAKAPNERNVASLFLYQTEALLLAILELGVIFAVAVLSESTSKCFMELHTAMFCALVLFVTQVLFITASALNRQGVSATHKSIGHAGMAAIALALIVYAHHEIQSTVCAAVFVAGYTVITFVPLLIVTFVCTPIEETPAVIFTREGIFFTAVSVATFTRDSDQLSNHMALGVIVPTVCIAFFSAMSSIFTFFNANHWLDVIPQILMLLLVTTYMILALLNMHPFKDIGTNTWYTIIALLGTSLVLCITYLISFIIKTQRQQEDVQEPKVSDDDNEPSPLQQDTTHNSEIPVNAAAIASVTMADVARAPVIDFHNIIMQAADTGSKKRL